MGYKFHLKHNKVELLKVSKVLEHLDIERMPFDGEYRFSKNGW